MPTETDLLVLHIASVDRAIEATGATMHQGVGSFPTTWMPRLKYTEHVKNYQADISAKEYEFLNTTADMGKSFFSNLKREIGELKLQLHHFLYRCNPYNAEFMDPQLAELNAEKGRLVYRLRMMQCSGHVGGTWFFV
jgi:hypothetical protein